jgi:hypothetical protein
MDRLTLWLCVAGGVLLTGYGIARLYRGEDWVGVMLGVLIIGFSLSAVVKRKQNKP